MLAKRITIGDLRDQLMLRKRTVSTDDYGAEVETWSDDTAMYCKVDYAATGDREEYAGDVQTVFQTILFTVRHYPGLVTTTKRILYDGNELDIINLATDAKKEFQTITCQLRQ